MSFSSRCTRSCAATLAPRLPPTRLAHKLAVSGGLVTSAALWRCLQDSGDVCCSSRALSRRIAPFVARISPLEGLSARLGGLAPHRVELDDVEASPATSKRVQRARSELGARPRELDGVSSSGAASRRASGRLRELRARLRVFGRLERPSARPLTAGRRARRATRDRSDARRRARARGAAGRARAPPGRPRRAGSRPAPRRRR